MNSVDYIIIGQGLAGSALAWELSHRGHRVMVMDAPDGNQASRVAAGICNPITGRVMSTTYKAEVIFPALEKFYHQAGQELGKVFYRSYPIFRPFPSADDARQWKEKSKESTPSFVTAIHSTPFLKNEVHNPHGGIEIASSGFLDVKNWIHSVREWLTAGDSYRAETFSNEKLQVSPSIDYNGIAARKIIFCDGLHALGGEWFHWVPLRPLKGETLEISASITLSHIISGKVYLVPSGVPGRFVAGSTYDRQPFEDGTTEKGRQFLQSTLSSMVRFPFEVIHQDWGIRPAVQDRRPLLGAHPGNENVVIFNGLGTKGVSLSPYFAGRLASWLEGSEALDNDVNINRFKSLYWE